MKEDMQEVLHYDYFIYYNIIGILSPPLQLFYLLQHHWHLKSSTTIILFITTSLASFPY
jgi:hypothetical protein